MRRGSVSVRRESVGVEERESVVERVIVRRVRDVDVERKERDVDVERKEKDVVERMGSVRRVRDVERENVRKEKDVDVERKERDVVERSVIVSVKEERDVMEKENVRKERDVVVERRKDVRVIAVRNNLKRSAWLV